MERAKYLPQIYWSHWWLQLFCLVNRENRKIVIRMDLASYPFQVRRRYTNKDCWFLDFHRGIFASRIVRLLVVHLLDHIFDVLHANVRLLSLLIILRKRMAINHWKKWREIDHVRGLRTRARRAGLAPILSERGTSISVSVAMGWRTFRVRFRFFGTGEGTKKWKKELVQLDLRMISLPSSIGLGGSTRLFLKPARGMIKSIWKKKKKTTTTTTTTTHQWYCFVSSIHRVI